MIAADLYPSISLTTVATTGTRHDDQCFFEVGQRDSKSANAPAFQSCSHIYSGQRAWPRMCVGEERWAPERPLPWAAEEARDGLGSPEAYTIHGY